MDEREARRILRWYLFWLALVITLSVVGIGVALS